MKSNLFSTIFFAVIVFFSSCGAGAGENTENSDSIAKAGQESNSAINLTNFSSIPDSLAGCSCIFSESESEYNANHYLYFDDMGTACIISINNKTIVLKPKKITDEVSEFSNDEYTVYIKNKKKIDSGEESTTMTGELVIENKSGTTFTKKVYGVCGC